MRERCPHCGLPLETGDGFFLGSMTISYGLIVFGFLAPVAALWVFDVMAESWAIGLSLGGTVVLSLVLYRPSKFWWLAAYYGFLVHELPTNRLARGVLEAGDDRM